METTTNGRFSDEQINGHPVNPPARSSSPGKKIAFDDEIPKAGPELFIKRMQGNEAKTFTVWGTSIRGLWVHWNGGASKSEPHYEENCAGCNNSAPKRWKGFLHCYCQEDRQELFLELTPGSATSIMSQLDDPSNLRGSILRVKRTAAKNGRLVVQFLSPIKDTTRLPPEKDPRKSILKLWGVPAAVIEELFGTKTAAEGPDDDETPECL